MKEKNANPRAVGQPATKAMKKKLAEIVDDPTVCNPHIIGRQGGPKNGATLFHGLIRSAPTLAQINAISFLT